MPNCQNKDSSTAIQLMYNSHPALQVSLHNALKWLHCDFFWWSHSWTPPRSHTHICAADSFLLLCYQVVRFSLSALFWWVWQQFLWQQALGAPKWKPSPAQREARRCHALIFPELSLPPLSKLANQLKAAASSRTPMISHRTEMHSLHCIQCDFTGNIVHLCF